MKQLSKISILFVFFAFHTGLSAQQWVKPQPLMSKPILKNFLETHQEYPSQALQNKEEGTVIIAYSVDEKGNIDERHLIQSVSHSIDSSALHLFDLILWKPAKYYGIAMKSPASANSGFQIKYNIKKYNKLVKKRGYDQLPQPFKAVDTSNTVYQKTMIDQTPSVVLDSTFRTLNELIYSQITYPAEAVKLNISGIVRLSFIVETSGLPSNLLVKETVGGGCTEEAIGVVQQIQWNPGIKNKIAVRTQIELSIKFDNPAKLKNKHIPNQSNSGM